MNSSEFKTLLNEHQRRALSTRLGILDRQLLDAERLVGGDLPGGEMFVMTSDLTQEERAAILTLIAVAREHISKLRQRFNLDVQRQALRHWLLGHLSVLWAILEDSYAAKLRGFGEVSPALALELDPEVDQLAKAVNRIKSRITAA